MSDRISTRVTPDAFVQALWAEVERHPAVAHPFLRLSLPFNPSKCSEDRLRPFFNRSRLRKFVSSGHEPLPSGAARAGAAGGLLIQAAVGSGGGSGTPRGKRSGCAW